MPDLMLVFLDAFQIVHCLVFRKYTEVDFGHGKVNGHFDFGNGEYQVGNALISDDFLKHLGQFLLYGSGNFLLSWCFLNSHSAKVGIPVIIVIFGTMRKTGFGLYLILITIGIGSYQLQAQGNLQQMRQLIFEKTNALRAEKGLPELILLDSLGDLAQWHSENMVKHNFYAHVDHLGLNPIERAEKYKVKAWAKKGNRFTGIGENIAKTPWFENVAGCGDTRSEERLAQCMVNGWKNSPPHYKNILGDYTYLGVGLYFDKKGMGFGTQNFR